MSLEAPTCDDRPIWDVWLSKHARLDVMRDQDDYGDFLTAHKAIHDSTEPLCRLCRRGFRPAVSPLAGVALQDDRHVHRMGAGFDRMYREADAALYHAKSRGKHRFSHFEDSMAMRLTST